MKSKRIGLYLAGVHVVVFFVIVIFISNSLDPQAPMAWAFLAIIDFPISLVYMLIPGPAYSNWLAGLGTSILAQIFYMPHIIHGFLGTIWWYFLPRIVMPKKLGGIWGK